MVSSRSAQESVSCTALIAIVRSRALHGGLRHDADTDVAFNQTTDGIEAAQLHTQTKRTAYAIRLVGKESLDCAGAVEADHVVVKHFGKADVRPGRKRMFFCNHEHEPVASERKRIQAAVVDGTGNDADIGVAFGNQAYDFVTESLLEVHTDVRIGHQEGAQRLRQELGERIGV